MAAHPVDLLTGVLRELVRRNDLDPAQVDDVIGGCVTQAGELSLNITRNAVFAAGFPETTYGDGGNIQDPAAARLLAANGAPSNLPQAIFAYNHSIAHVQLVLSWAARYAAGGTQAISAAGNAACQQAALGPLPSGTAGKILAWAEAQLSKPYLYGTTGPDAYDCSGVAMMAYRAAGITIPRTSQAQCAYGTQIPASQAQPGDLVFFAGSEGTPAAHTMIDAYATGYPVEEDTYGLRASKGGLSPVVGFTRPVGTH